MDGRHVSRSVVVVNKQYQLMKEGHSEQAALQLAQKAVEDEERKTLEQVSRLIIDYHRIHKYRKRRLGGHVDTRTVNDQLYSLACSTLKTATGWTFDSFLSEP